MTSVIILLIKQKLSLTVDGISFHPCGTQLFYTVWIRLTGNTVPTLARLTAHHNTPRLSHTHLHSHDKRERSVLGSRVRLFWGYCLKGVCVYGKMMTEVETVRVSSVQSDKLHVNTRMCFRGELVMILSQYIDIIKYSIYWQQINNFLPLVSGYSFTRHKACLANVKKCASVVNKLELVLLLFKYGFIQCPTLPT